MTVPRSQREERVPRTIWVGLLAVVVYLLFAAVLGNILGDLADGDTASFALSHLIPLPIAIVLALLFVRWSGWAGVWSEVPTFRMQPRRWWLVVIPVLAVALPLGQVADIDWGTRSAGVVVTIVVGTILVGFGEELSLRGILLTAVRGRHGEFVTLVVTAVTFALAHVVGSIWGGVPLAGIAFQVAALTSTGVTYYWIRRVTGKLWVGIAVHALTDCVLYLTSSASSASEALINGPGTITNQTFLATVQVLLIIAVLVSVVSVIREDRRSQRVRRDAVPAT
ncbi:type II CAAX endopeptidase family protein [Curtobacterium sp. MCSS17_005]|uniref:CPBP family intramembrane glutamic endopeptidase n=1 Tax=Curtobacterium sp. MCSS17_005 TaxID=2175641 RepID=UPI0024DF4161|nr:type II CAAX endopeptidase family protein [Curtobacterium sp. MCSS17_005]WIB33081.1 type II CAAX endopeptidase family protein [Curtobacterium sp. MCSS17_005]